MRKCPVVPGRAYSFSYPRYNYDGLPDRTELRRIKVISVRDIKSEPLDPETIELRPTLNRGRWLVTAEDLDKGEERSFYSERMVELSQIEDLHLQTLPGMEFCVIENRRVSFATTAIGEAFAFVIGRGKGVVCSLVRSKAG